MKSNKTVLVVEDDPGIRTTLQHLLEAEGYTVLLTAHGKEGLEMLRQIKPPCVVLLDIQMPEMDGYEFLREKNADPAVASVPVVVVSATVDPTALKGTAAIVAKPFEIPNLLEVVEHHCGKGHPA